jgi:hypothetical protein
VATAERKLNMPRRELIAMPGGAAVTSPVGARTRASQRRRGSGGASCVLRAATHTTLLLITAHVTPAFAQEDHVITAQASSTVRADACNSSVDKAYNLCMIQGLFNIGRVNCECTQSEGGGLPTWECVATARCKK